MNRKIITFLNNNIHMMWREIHHAKLMKGSNIKVIVDADGDITVMQWGANKAITQDENSIVIAVDNINNIDNLCEYIAVLKLEEKTAQIKARLEYLRGEIQAERISYEEIAELQSLKPFVDENDVELLQWINYPE